MRQLILGGNGAQLNRVSRHADLAHVRLLDLDKHIAVIDLRVLEQPVN